jgi:hypothetical protein
MVRTVYCRWEDCDGSDDATVGQEKEICPACGKVARWTTVPGRKIKERRKSPRVPFELSHNDKRFLRSLKIQAEDPPADNNDHESDGA